MRQYLFYQFSLALLYFKYFLIRIKAWRMYSAVRHIFPIFCLKFRVLSIVILANSASSDSLMLIDPTFRLNLKYFFHPKIINQNFLGLRQLIELILNQQRRFFILCSFLHKTKSSLVSKVLKWEIFAEKNP